MIPNSAPMAAVYRRISESRKDQLFSCPVVAWNDRGHALVVRYGTGYVLADPQGSAEIELLGLWPHGWSPSYDEMASLLPERRITSG